MKFVAKNLVLLALGVGCSKAENVSSVSEAQNDFSVGNIFDGKSMCSVYDLGGHPYYWNCPSIEKEIGMPGLSDGEASFMRRYISFLTFERRLLINFPCKSSRAPDLAKLTVGSTDFSLAATLSPMLQKFVLAGHQYNKNGRISLRFAASSIVQDPCRLDIVGNYAVPPISILKKYADDFIEEQLELNDSSAAITQAAALPEKWVVARSLASDMNELGGIKALKCRADLKDLKKILAIPSSSRSAEQGVQIRELSGLPEGFEGSLNLDNICPALIGGCSIASGDLDIIGGRIGEYQSESVNSFCLAKDLEQALPATSECNDAGDATNIFCIDKIMALQNTIYQRQTELGTVSASFIDFLTKEQQRLNTVEQAISSEIIAIINSLRGTND